MYQSQLFEICAYVDLILLLGLFSLFGCTDSRVWECCPFLFDLLRHILFVLCYFWKLLRIFSKGLCLVETSQLICDADWLSCFCMVKFLLKGILEHILNKPVFLFTKLIVFNTSFLIVLYQHLGGVFIHGS